MGQCHQGEAGTICSCDCTSLGPTVSVQAALREQPPLLMVVGNKSDRAEQRCVGMEEGRKLALVGTISGSCTDCNIGYLNLSVCRSYRPCFQRPVPCLVIMCSKLTAHWHGCC